MTDKRKCLYCDRAGVWQSGICPRDRAYLKRTGDRPMAWRIERKESIGRRSELLDQVIRVSSRGKVVHLRRKVANA